MDAEILTQRAEITRAIEGQTVCGLLELAARQFADRPALSEPAGAGDPDQPERNRAGAAEPRAVAGRP